jgi:hypothetical protein
MVANVFHAIAVLAVVETLVFDLLPFSSSSIPPVYRDRNL